MNTVLTAALDMAGHGLPVFPLPARSKVPSANSHGFKDATVDGGLLQRKLIAAGDSCNLGIATGTWGFVLDSDGPKAKEWLAAHDRLPRTWTVRTTRGGHRYFRCKESIPSIPKDELAPEVEIKGVGGYVLFPPSVHPSGQPYKWLVGPEDMPAPAEAPKWLVDLLLQHQTAKSSRSAEPVGEIIPNGQRNGTLASLAGTMRRLGLSETAIAAALLEENAIRCQPPLDESEVRTIAKSVGRYKPETSGEIRHSSTEAVEEPAGPLPEGVTTAGRARLYDLSAYRPDLESAETDWMIKDWILRGQIHLFVGEEKRGKSTQQWRRIAAVSRGDLYLSAPARKARVLAITEMGPDVVRTLLDDDDIEPDWSQVRVAFVDELAREDRLAVIGDAVKEWKPAYLTLDPIDECFGLDESGVFNPAKTADAFESIRLWANQGITIDALYHYNNQGKIANSYKFRAKPDHIYRIRGTEPADVTYEYQGRVRAIPRKRRVAGNGDEGYEVTLISGGQVGRPAKTRQLIQQALEGCTIPLSVVELSKRTGVPYPATKQALMRAVKKAELEHVEGQGYRLKEGYGKPPYITSPVSYPPTGSSSKDGYETPLSLKEGNFVPAQAPCAHSNVSTRDGQLFSCSDCGLDYELMEVIE